ncbi:hypothetical protein HRR83_001106 [Exophiala dermatitidis]|nr:hypothetical protein HRR75_001010 [Exophiala dermatitidis]KAJ4525917.1 hypothetical protein HRR74_001110 [Exophiala dermatitidis]KAJ4527136.1 hypothetical protein HRR73_001933 [Exophiala dermatitidis]KAJ4532857.1 hypothetical protein HRR76_007834 [Exophiala dermatitidis]KAJ4538874.1 hypothetical protein HRR77_006797 [Exophiala dermatitidis]
MSTSPPPRQRFVPEPLETTIRSSTSAYTTSHSPSSSEGQASNTTTGPMPVQTKPRRFLPQPVEESTRSSRKKAVEHIESSDIQKESTESNSLATSTSSADNSLSNGPVTTIPRRFAPEPVETSTRTSRRRFAPEPVETSTRSSKDKDNPADGSSSKPRRKFAPEPVETTTISSKDKKLQGTEENQPPRPRRKFLPEPIETTTRRRRNTEQENPEDLSKSAGSTASSRASSGPRKFSPELIETAKGSYRRVHPSTAESKAPVPPRRPSSPRPASPRPDSDATPRIDPATGLEESRFSAAALARRRPDTSRQHSFVVPDLPMIESTTEDETSSAPSLSESPSSSVSTENRQETSRPPIESSYTDYVLRLAAETVSEKELQEQAMAAYINERPYEPVDHFAFTQEEEEEAGSLAVPMFQGEQGVDVQVFRRSSAAELHLEMRSMQRHHEQLESAKNELKADTAGQSRFSAAALASRHALEAKGANQAKKARAAEEDSELARMMKAASPPMLGGSLVFPFTISPKMTRCDPDQPPRPRTENSGDESMDQDNVQLWHSHKRPENNADGGLWMGMCKVGMWQPVNHQMDGLRTGIQTPAPLSPVMERNNPFDSMTPGRGRQTPAGRQQRYSGMNFLPLTPPRSTDGDDGFTSTIDKKLQLEKQIDEEFPPRVITQIYNYLSLGYPSLAHMFDEELSKISRIPVEELRRDDNLADAKGYVGAPEGDGCHESEVVGKCKRWEALRLYVREWARQSPNFLHESMGPVVISANDDWGARARKGSWGF